jgi:hypothetical protein
MKIFAVFWRGSFENENHGAIHPEPLVIVLSKDSENDAQNLTHPI